MIGSSLIAGRIYLDRIIRTVDGNDGAKMRTQANGGMNGTPPITASKIVR
jgi:hypothetical protein